MMIQDLTRQGGEIPMHPFPSLLPTPLGMQGMARRTLRNSASLFKTASVVGRELAKRS